MIYIKPIKYIIQKIIRIAFFQGFDAGIRRALYMLNQDSRAQQKSLYPNIKLEDFRELAPGSYVIQKNQIVWQGLAYTSLELVLLASSPFAIATNPQASFFTLKQTKASYNLRYDPANISTIAVYQGNDFLCFIRAIKLRHDASSYLKLSLQDWKTIKANLRQRRLSKTHIRDFIFLAIEASKTIQQKEV